MYPKIFSASEIFKKLPKENNRPIGETSSNPVTLFCMHKSVTD
jgi:hypothetical protein